MFRVMLFDKREGIHSAVKYLLHRYELVFCRELKDALVEVEEGVDLAIITFPIEDESSENIEKLKEFVKNRKVLAILDHFSHEQKKEADTFGVINCIDKLDIGLLPELVNRYLNQAVTRILMY